MKKKIDLKIQWGLEYQTHWNTEHFEIRILNGLVLEWSVKAIVVLTAPEDGILKY